MLRPFALPLLGLSLALLSACSSAPVTPSTTGGNVVEPVEPSCTEPAAIPCEDAVYQGLNLQTDVAPGLITNEMDAAGGGFLSLIDATAGGFSASDPDSYVYGRFTDMGLEKVEISDEESLAQMDWDIAFRRYAVRINSGNSGPSCVAAARVVGMTYDSLTAAPEGLVFRKDEYFTEGSCEMIPHSSGLPGAAETVLSGYWAYTEKKPCVWMSHFVYVLGLADGRQLKLTVESYYHPDVQEQCDSNGTIPMTGTGSANIRVRWAFLP
jgi:hypothetical protein